MPDASFGEWAPIEGDGTHENPYSFPHYRLSKLGSSFFNMAYHTGWVLIWPWSDWAHGPEGQLLAHNRDALGRADVDQLSKLLTTIIRQDRFCDGVLASAFESGLLLAIAERAEMLLSYEGADRP
jgi:hypothetical protein